MTEIDKLTGTVIHPDRAADASQAPEPAAEQPAAVAPYVIVRANEASCFAGELVEVLDYTHGVVALRQARRLWYWEGANDLSELATTGTSKRSECKFGAPVDVVVIGAIEVITATQQAWESISAVPHWTTQ